MGTRLWWRWAGRKSPNGRAILECRAVERVQFADKGSRHSSFRWLWKLFGQDLKLRWLLHPLALEPHCWMEAVEMHIPCCSCWLIFSRLTSQRAQWPRIRQTQNWCENAKSSFGMAINQLWMQLFERWRIYEVIRDDLVGQWYFFPEIFVKRFKSTAADELNACLKTLSFWRHVNQLKLTTNMRAALQTDPSGAEFSRQLLALANDQNPVDVSTGLISFPAKFWEYTSSKEELITKVLPGITQI